MKTTKTHTLYSKTLFYVIFFMCVYSCSSTRYVPKGKYLLNKVNISIDDKRIDKKDAKNYIKQKPNSRIFSTFRLYLGIYNLSGANQNKKINKYLRRVGEPPVLYDSIKTQRSVVQLKRFLENKGFYKAEIKATPSFSKKKVEIKYNIKANKPKTIGNIVKQKDSLNYKVIGKKIYQQELSDTTILRRTLINKKKNMLQKGDLFDIDNLKEERSELTKLFKNKGYYRISEKNIHFYIDTTAQEQSVNLAYGLRANKQKDTIRYKINKVVVNLSGKDALRELNTKADSVLYSNVLFINKGKMPYKYKMLAKAIVIKEGNWYSTQDIRLTKKNLAELQQFRYIGVRFLEEKSTNSSEGKLTCYIQLRKKSSQSYGLEATTTFNSGNFGFRQGIFYKHRNLFKGAEIFNIKLLSGFEQLKGYDIKKFDVEEYGGEIKLSTPKFFLPWLRAEHWRAKSPRTEISTIFNYNERPQYTRTISDITFSYRWKAKNLRFVHILTPIDIGILKVRADENFLNTLNDYYRKTSYVDHIISASRYSMLYNNRGRTKKTTFQRFRFSVEIAGNFLNMINKLSKSKEEKTDKKLETAKFETYFDIRYAQYFKTEIDFAYNQFIDRNNAIIYHFSGGIGVPYGNSEVMPFEKMYFLGGTNSMRAWNTRSLGPGTSTDYTPASSTSFGEMKLEANLEYRFKIINKLEGAFFTDIGNVWNISSPLVEKDTEGAFYWDNFYKQIAIGSGLGLRLDISNIILRLDAGVKILDPYLEKNKRFISSHREWNFNDIAFNFGIGYPF